MTNNSIEYNICFSVYTSMIAIYSTLWKNSHCVKKVLNNVLCFRENSSILTLNINVGSLKYLVTFNQCEIHSLNSNHHGRNQNEQIKITHTPKAFYCAIWHLIVLLLLVTFLQLLLFFEHFTFNESLTTIGLAVKSTLIYSQETMD